jgi:hypothetical protein
LILARCLRFASVLWTLTWVEGDRHRWAFLFRHHRAVRRVTAPTPQPLRSSFITFFSYSYHTLAPQSVRRYLDSAPSRSAPVSRDERVSGLKLFTCSLTTNGPGQHTRKCTPNRKIKR